MATLGAAFSGTNAVYEVPSFWIWESQIIAPFMNVSETYCFGHGVPSSFDIRLDPAYKVELVED